MKKLLIMCLMIFMVTGCSFLPKITFNRTTSTLPQSTEKTTKIIKCKGDIVLDNFGRVQTCTGGYVSNENYYNQAERKFTLFEHIGNFVSNLKGWFGILVLVSIVLVFMGGGGLVVTIWSNIFGVASRGMKSLVTGISKAKTYVKNNGNNYTDRERLIYQQGASDFLTKISEEIKDKNILKEINIIRAEVKDI